MIVQKQHDAVVYMFGANLGKLQRTQIPSKHGDLRGPSIKFKGDTIRATTGKISR